MSNKYTKETLIKINPVYLSNHYHEITSYEIETANRLVQLIESSRSKTNPKTGDIIRLTNHYGEYYHHAHIENIENKSCSVCEVPYVPFIVETNDELCCSASGGAWCTLQIDKLKYVGKETKTFCFWGLLGPCANGSVKFQADVSVWEYVDENPIYGKYTTKDYDRHFVHYRADKHGNPINGSAYVYFGQGFAFKNKQEYNLWIKTYKGVEIGDYSDGPVAVFAYKEVEKLISKEEWDKLDLLVDTRCCNGIIPVKVKYDNDNHVIYTYRFTNSSRNLNTSLQLYSLARKNQLIDF